MRHHFTQPFEGFHADAQRQHMAGGACMLFNVILQRATGSQADEGLVENLGEMHPAAVCERVPGGCYQGQTVLCDRLQLQALRIDRIGDDSGLSQAGGNGSHDVRTGALLQLDMQTRPIGKPGGEPGRQEFRQRGRVGIEMKGTARARGEILQLALEQCLLTQHQACMVGQRFPGLGGNDAAGVTFQKRYARIRFDAAQACADRGQRQVGARSTLGDAAGIRDAEKQMKIREIEPHAAILHSSFG